MKSVYHIAAKKEDWEQAKQQRPYRVSTLNKAYQF